MPQDMVYLGECSIGTVILLFIIYFILFGIIICCANVLHSY